MHIPIAVDYGVRALVDMAQHADEGLARTADIARRNAIPELYLEQLLHTLNKRGLTRSQRGPQGGHTLAVNPSDITLTMVVAALGETPALVPCMDNLDKCSLTPGCAQRDVWRTVEQAIRSVLDTTTIEDLASRVRQAPQAAKATPEHAQPRKVPVAVSSL